VRISELSRRSGVSVATIKYYLREGLVPAGEATSATQAAYGEQHVARLALVRALLDAGGLTVARARRVLAVVDDDGSSVHDALGVATEELAVSGRPAPDLAPARAHLGRWGWRVHDESPALAQLACALTALDDARFPTTDALLDRYARAARELGTQDVAEVPVTPRAEAVQFVVVGTLLLEPVLVALRRLAQEDASLARFGPPA
jgi:DNA-binding transcriptional MerR regulator